MARDTGWLGSATQLTRKMSDGPEVMEEHEYIKLTLAELSSAIDEIEEIRARLEKKLWRKI